MCMPLFVVSRPQATTTAAATTTLLARLGRKLMCIRFMGDPNAILCRLTPEDRDRSARPLSARMILPFRVSLQLPRIKVHGAKISLRVPRRLIVEVLRRRIPALSTRRDGSGPHTVAELDDGDE